MTDDVEVVERKVVDSITVFNVSQEDNELFHQIMREHGRKGNVAFRALLDSYCFAKIVGETVLKLQLLEQRVFDLENKDKKELKTFGGK
jgi:hypothetical protein